MRILSHRLAVQVRDPDSLMFLESLVECLVEDKRLLSVLRYEENSEVTYAVKLMRFVPADVGRLFHIGSEWRPENWEMVETTYFHRRYHAMDCFEQAMKYFIYG